MKFICDHMLIKLGKWLRAAGYDTTIADGKASDLEIMQQALAEERILVTRDRHFHCYSLGEKLVWLKSNHLEDCIKEFSEKVPINWTYKPFTRCLLCNEEFIKDQLKKLDYCPICQKFYWFGSHTDSMLLRLNSWKS